MFFVVHKPDHKIKGEYVYYGSHKVINVGV